MLSFARMDHRDQRPISVGSPAVSRIRHEPLGPHHLAFAQDMDYDAAPPRNYVYAPDNAAGHFDPEQDLDDYEPHPFYARAGSPSTSPTQLQPSHGLYADARDVLIPQAAASASADRKRRLGKAKERVRIELAPDQPPTTQGKERERVFVACLHW